MAVVGYTMHIKDKLKEAGGKWNPKYKGWIFSKKRRTEIQSIIDENPSEVQKDNKVESKKEIPQISERDILESKKRVLEEEQKKRIES